MNNAGNGYHIIGSWPRESDEDTRMSGGLLNSRWQPPPHQNPIIRNVTVNAIAPTPHRPILVPENATWVPTGAEEAARNAPAAVPAAVPDAKTAHPDGACLTQQSYNFLFRTFQVLQISLSISIFWVEILFLAVWITPHPDHQTSAGKAMHAVSFLLGLLAPIYTAMCLHSGLVESVRVLFVDSILLGAWLVLAVFAAIELPTDAQKEDNRFYAACCVRLTLIVVLSLAYVIGVCSQFCSLIIGRARARAREQAPAQAQVQPPA
ncbi:hypothetical protein GGS21DRAFT_533105 [Xylaria nigripes]|nr:hypothetical protein GGS21DRAFT_533105 [Xylaria nigripes]